MAGLGTDVPAFQGFSIENRFERGIIKFFPREIDRLDRFDGADHEREQSKRTEESHPGSSFEVCGRLGRSLVNEPTQIDGRIMTVDENGQRKRSAKCGGGFQDIE